MKKTFEEIINFIISENLKFLIVAIEKRVRFNEFCNYNSHKR